MAATGSWIDRTEALARLGVQAQTLYAYVSRGRVEARPDPLDPRRSLYSGSDVDQLARRRRTGRKRESVAGQAMAWGDPVLVSTISTVRSNRLIYRGVDAVRLAETADFESVAALLWETDRATVAQAEPGEPPGGPPMAGAFHVLAGLAAHAAPALGRGPRVLCAEAASVVRRLATALAGVAPAHGEPVHVQLARGLGAQAAADAIRRTLVLVADHELNASTFAVRVTASTGASLAAASLAGLCALSGPLHGAAGLALSELLREAERVGAAEALRARIALGQRAPGFGHPLYGGVDPRAAAILDTLQPPPRHVELRQAAGEVLGLEPNVDFALSALTAAYALPAVTPFVLFAVGRSAGWMAHAMEQAREGRLIRPRARYAGRTPPPP